MCAAPSSSLGSMCRAAIFWVRMRVAFPLRRASSQSGLYPLRVSVPRPGTVSNSQ
ncbi:hypothetical protein L842_5704 [Mycobacterium intracellulare MIN_052511_1280]|nr:hypothetical protein L842_5704 [Mycobacterium intracellulare MIN_052511_1280]